MSEIASLAKKLDGHVSSFHIDVMDNQFVPNYTLDRFSPPFISSLRLKSEKHVHLMTEIPSKYYNSYAEAGARSDRAVRRAPVDLEVDVVAGMP